MAEPARRYRRSDPFKGMDTFALIAQAALYLSTAQSRLWVEGEELSESRRAAALKFCATAQASLTQVRELLDAASLTDDELRAFLDGT